MSHSIRGTTLFGVLCVSLITAITFSLWPMVAVAFEAGLLAGVFLHVAHCSDRSTFA